MFQFLYLLFGWWCIFSFPSMQLYQQQISSTIPFPLTGFIPQSVPGIFQFPFPDTSSPIGVTFTQQQLDVTQRQGQSQKQLPPAIEYLGTGYDAVYGNPSQATPPTMLDPGFRSPILTPFFNGRRPTARYRKPEGVTIQTIPICQQHIDVIQITSTAAYQQQLSLDAVLAESIFPMGNNPNNATLAALLFLFPLLFTNTSSPPLPTSSDTSQAINDVTSESIAPEVTAPLLLALGLTQAGTTTSTSTSTSTSTTRATTNDTTIFNTASTTNATINDTTTFNTSHVLHHIHHLLHHNTTNMTQSCLIPTVFPSIHNNTNTSMNHMGNIVPTEIFLANAVVREVATVLDTKAETIFYSRALCTQYVAEWDSFVNPPTTLNFINAVKTLPEKYPINDDFSLEAIIARELFANFIAEFGTHYTHRMIFGGKRILQVHLIEEQVDAMISAGFDLQSALVALVMGQEMNPTESQLNTTMGKQSKFNMTERIKPFNMTANQQSFDATLLASAAADAHGQKFGNSIFHNAILSTSLSNIGGFPTSSYYDWTLTVSERVVPVQYTLKPIYSLLTEPQRTALREATTEYIASQAIP